MELGGRMEDWTGNEYKQLAWGTAVLLGILAGAVGCAITVGVMRWLGF